MVSLRNILIVVAAIVDTGACVSSDDPALNEQQQDETIEVHACQGNRTVLVLEMKISNRDDRGHPRIRASSAAASGGPDARPRNAVSARFNCG